MDDNTLTPNQQEFKNSESQKKENQSENNTLGHQDHQQPSIEIDSFQVKTMEGFFEGKYQEIAQLQTFLVQEFQNIQNWKAKKIHFKNCIFKKILPFLSEYKREIKQISDQFFARSKQTVNYIQKIRQKAEVLILQKHNELLRRNQEILKLNAEIHKLQKHFQNENIDKYTNTSENMNLMKMKSTYFNNQMEGSKIDDKIKNNHQKISDIYWPKGKSKQALANCFPSSNVNKMRPSNSMTKIKATRIQIQDNKQNFERKSISPKDNKLMAKPFEEINKYEEYYKKIKNKENQQVKDQKILIIEDSEAKVSFIRTKSMKRIGDEVKKSLKEDFQNSKGDRKEFIKQKIERIKIKAEYRQNRKEGLHQTYFK